MVDYSKWNKLDDLSDEDEDKMNRTTVNSSSLSSNRDSSISPYPRPGYKPMTKEEYAAKKKEMDEKRKEAQRQADEVMENYNWDGLTRTERKETQEADEMDKEIRVSFSKTCLNKPKPVEFDVFKEFNEIKEFKEFLAKNKDRIQEYALSPNAAAAKKYLLENPDICCGDAAYKVTLICLEYEYEGNRAMMEQVSKQLQTLQAIIRYAQTEKQDPRDSVRTFFLRMKFDDARSVKAFEEELQTLRKQIIKRVQMRRDNEAAKKSTNAADSCKNTAEGKDGASETTVSGTDSSAVPTDSADPSDSEPSQ